MNGRGKPDDLWIIFGGGIHSSFRNRSLDFAASPLHGFRLATAAVSNTHPLTYE